MVTGSLKKMEHKDLIREEFTRQANDYELEGCGGLSNSLQHSFQISVNLVVSDA